jgi:hypothetical protein
MQIEAFAELTSSQQLTMMIAMHVRNSMESFHGDGNLSDAQMKELNPIIRQAIYDVVVGGDPELIGWLIMLIPDYWEVPDRVSGSWETRRRRVATLRVPRPENGPR